MRLGVSIPALCQSLIRTMLVLILALLLPVLAAAQDAAPEEAAAPEAAAPAAGEEPPAYPVELADPLILPEVLELRLLPLGVDALSPLAGAWQANAQAQLESVVEKQIELLSLEGAEAEAKRAEIVGLAETRKEVFGKFGTVLTALETKGGAPEEVAAYRTWRNAVFVTEKQQADVRTLLREAINWMVSPDGGIQLALRVGVVIGAFFGLGVVARVIRAWARRALGRIPNLSKLLQAFLAIVIYWLTIAIGLMIVLSALGVDITPIFALVGGASFIAAFALQDTLGNLAAGLMIMINRPFDEGDYVSVAGTSGTVNHVSIVATTVTTPDNQVIVIPNSRVWGDVITNTSASETRRVDLTFGIGYDDSIEEAEAVLAQVVAAHPAILQDPAPVIRLNTLNDSSVDFVVRPWVKAADYWSVYWDLTRQVKEAFDAKGITIPYPQTEMTIRNAPAALSGTAQ